MEILIFLEFIAVVALLYAVFGSKGSIIFVRPDIKTSKGKWQTISYIILFVATIQSMVQFVLLKNDQGNNGILPLISLIIVSAAIVYNAYRKSRK